MQQLFPAIFATVWKRKETKIYLALAFFPIIYLVASFFSGSNFMQISVEEGYRLSCLAFVDMMINSVDGFILPTLALYFLTISVFKREVDDHTMFLYRDLNRTFIFRAKYTSVLVVLGVFYSFLILVSTVVFYTRVAHLPFGSLSIFDPSLKETMVLIFHIITFFLKDVFSVSLAVLLCLYLKNGLTIVIALCMTIAMMIAGIINSPVTMIFPTGFIFLANESLQGTGLAFLGALGVTSLYSFVCTRIAVTKFNKLEF